MIKSTIVPGTLVRGTFNTPLYSTMLYDINDSTLMLQKAAKPTLHWLQRDEVAWVIGMVERMVYVFSPRVSGWAYPEDLDVIVDGENAATREVVSSP